MTPTASALNGFGSSDWLLRTGEETGGSPRFAQHAYRFQVRPLLVPHVLFVGLFHSGTVYGLLRCANCNCLGRETERITNILDRINTNWRCDLLVRFAHRKAT